MLVTTKIVRTALFAGVISVFMQGIAVNAGEVEKNQLIIDVALTSSGNLNGKVVNASHLTMPESEVVVTQGSKEVVRTVTDINGEFTVKNLNQGVYKITSVNGNGYFRVWESSYAPPVAESQATIVTGRQVVRGQAGSQISTALGVVAVVGATTAVAIEATEGDDDEDASP